MGGGARYRLCTPTGLTGARASSEVIDFNQELERLELNGVVDLKWWLAESLVVWGENAAGGSTLLLKASQINIQTELQRQGEVLIFQSQGLLNSAGWIQGAECAGKMQMTAPKLTMIGPECQVIIMAQNLNITFQTNKITEENEVFMLIL